MYELNVSHRDEFLLSMDPNYFQQWMVRFGNISVIRVVILAKNAAVSIVHTLIKQSAVY